MILPGEQRWGGPMAEIPVDLVRENFETNVFSPLDFTQRVVRNWGPRALGERW
jgi:NAD(P)-dependent dehydrogenase (short-subunit alcohol dehydrogenase family)